MDKLQWFKFTPSDWMMGKIQRCQEITQARFLRLCCLYWNKDCEISIDDAIIEIDKEHYDVLVSKKIISVNDKNINISFLDEQNLEIKEVSKYKSTSGIVGNLKRWHNVIYQRFKSKEISLEEAIELSKIIAPPSHTDSTPIAPPSQIIADKIKTIKDEEESIKEKIRKENLFKKDSKTEKFFFRSEMIKYGFETKLVDEWLLIRKNKKATNTQTAFEQFIKEIETRPSNINEVLKTIVTNSWSGFKYTWIDNLKNTENGKSGNNHSGNTTPRTNELAEQSYNAVAKLLGRTQ